MLANDKKSRVCVCGWVGGSGGQLGKDNQEKLDKLGYNLSCRFKSIDLNY